MIAGSRKLCGVYNSFSSFIISYKTLYQLRTLMKFNCTVYMVYIERSSTVENYIHYTSHYGKIECKLLKEKYSDRINI